MNITVVIRSKRDTVLSAGQMLEVVIEDSPTGKAALIAAVEAALILRDGVAVSDRVLELEREVAEARQERNAAISALDQAKAELETRKDG